MNSKHFDDIRLKEVQIFVQLAQAGSVRDLARQTGYLAGFISKAIKSLEAKVGQRLFERSHQGVKLTPDGREIYSSFKKIYDLQLKLEHQVSNEKKTSHLLAIGAHPVLASALVPQLVGEFIQQDSECRFRVLEFNAKDIVSIGLRGGFQIALHTKKLDWPSTWASEHVGELHWCLFARKTHLLGKSSTQNRVLEFPFVFPSYWSQEGVILGNDNCPVPIGKRIIGHETATAQVAMELVKTTDHIGFLPEVLAREDLENQTLRKINVKGWKTISQPVYLSVKADYIRQSVFNDLCGILEGILS